LCMRQFLKDTPCIQAGCPSTSTLLQHRPFLGVLGREPIRSPAASVLFLFSVSSVFRAEPVFWFYVLCFVITYHVFCNRLIVCFIPP
jgi:hypothetical protein